ncbi:MAG: ABC transporter ATP-binding protein [Clostridia bacterium]|nr:ABC transporter ATP-binding protein [Clostridia bacterium]
MQPTTPIIAGQPLAIDLRGLTKTFGKVIANQDISLTLREGEILSLLGENGSGKTTLMNMLSGIYRPDSGAIFIHGQRRDIRSPIDAFKLGIGMIHQHFKLVDVLTVAENIVLGTPAEKGMSRAAITRKIADLSLRYGLMVDPNRKIYELSVSEKQTVEIMKVLYRNARILILDEPTAVLTPQEIDRLFQILRRMREQGNAIILITHKLHEVMEVSDRITVLRKGLVVDTVERANITSDALVEMMVGAAVDLSLKRPEPEPDAPVLLKVENLCVRGAEGELKLNDVSFDIRAGELLGVAGVAGSGQKELCEKLAGLLPAKSGCVKVIDIDNNMNEVDITHAHPRKIIGQRVSMSFIPEDRLGMGLVPSMSIADNMLLKTYHHEPGPLVRRKPAREQAEKLIERLSIATPSALTPVRRLSGGNVQKVLIGRELLSKPKVLITAYPVRGLDIHSSYAIYKMINKQKKNGAAVLFIGEDLDVLLGMCDRVMVLCGGKVMDIVDARTATKHQLGALMAGSIISDSKKGEALA